MAASYRGEPRHEPASREWRSSTFTTFTSHEQRQGKRWRRVDREFITILVDSGKQNSSELIQIKVIVTPIHFFSRQQPFSPRGEGDQRESRDASLSRDPAAAARDPSALGRENAPRDAPPRDPMQRDSMPRDPSHDRHNSPMKGGDHELNRFQPNGRPKSPSVGATGELLLISVHANYF